MIETDALSVMIDDARHIPVPAPRVIDVTASERREIVIPQTTVTLLEDYELYVG